MDDNNTYTVAIKAYYTPKLPYKLLLELAFKKHKKFYIGPDKKTGSRTILRYFNNLIVGRATYKNGLYVV